MKIVSSWCGRANHVDDRNFISMNAAYASPAEQSPRGITVDIPEMPQAQHVLFEGQFLDLSPDSGPIALQPDGDTRMRVIAGSLASITALVPCGDVLPESLRPKKVGLWGGDDCELLRDIQTGVMAVSSSLVVLHRSPIDRPVTVDHRKRQGGVDHAIGAIDVIPAEYILEQREATSSDIVSITGQAHSERSVLAVLALENINRKDKTHSIGRLALMSPFDLAERHAVVGFLLCASGDLSVSVVAHNGLTREMPTALLVTTAIGCSVGDVPPDLLGRMQRSTIKGHDT